MSIGKNRKLWSTDTQVLQKNADPIVNWPDIWQMSLSESKTTLYVFDSIIAKVFSSLAPTPQLSS